MDRDGCPEKWGGDAPCGRGTHRRNTHLASHLSLPCACGCVRALPQAQQHGWVWFHSFSQSKQTQTALPAVSAWGHQGRQVSSSCHERCMQTALSWLGCSRLLLPCPQTQPGHQLCLASRWWEKPAHLSLWPGNLRASTMLSQEGEATLCGIQAGQK